MKRLIALFGTPTVAIVTARRQHRAAGRRPAWDVEGIGPTWTDEGPGLQLERGW